MLRIRRPLLVLITAGMLLPGGCQGPVAVDNPMETLTSGQTSQRQLLGAMVAMDAEPENPDYIKALKRIVWKPGYSVASREEAFVRLETYDPDGLKRTLRQQLPRMAARGGQERLLELIADRGWTELTPALVSSWSNRIGFVDDLDRAEYKALVRLYGEDHVVDAVFDVLVVSNKAYQRALRGRCWELLIRIGQRERLVELLENESVGPDDAMLIDLRAGAVDLRVIPQTREEILWMRKLHAPEHAAFWSQAAEVVRGLDSERLDSLELRELPILVAASIHDPWLLGASRKELYDRLAEHVRSTRQHIDPDRFRGFPGTYPQRLSEHRRDLKWGDLAAMTVAVRAIQVPQVVDHLFDYAERDRLDSTTEYGGVIALDDRGRFEILEFPPQFRRHDNEFMASQEMFDAGYSAVFHFHFHAQRHRNSRFAMPGIGDLNYSDNTRANCLVFTFVSDDTLNVDFYRHDRMIIDLGEVKKE